MSYNYNYPYPQQLPPQYIPGAGVYPIQAPIPVAPIIQPTYVAPVPFVPPPVVIYEEPYYHHHHNPYHHHHHHHC
ncbi:unnamed protein product [Caenorhabditis auriculariae]|uniref:Uncharacterized protein n=1 Tax=Caenorhabditis auriculariae TaxID=2777116 RepID=A0A8S1GP94_9PELO|nr:unnamed protein product [Caenorhabditis auriculariae]